MKWFSRNGNGFLAEHSVTGFACVYNRYSLSKGDGVYEELYEFDTSPWEGIHEIVLPAFDVWRKNDN